MSTPPSAPQRDNLNAFKRYHSISTNSQENNKSANTQTTNSNIKLSEDLSTGISKTDAEINKANISPSTGPLYKEKILHHLPDLLREGCIAFPENLTKANTGNLFLDMASAFGQTFIETLATPEAAQAGLDLAEIKIKDKLEKKENQAKTSDRSHSKNIEERTKIENRNSSMQLKSENPISPPNRQFSTFIDKRAAHFNIANLNPRQKMIFTASLALGTCIAFPYIKNTVEHPNPSDNKSI
ncbi:hypothetical protein [Diaphorobacter caeni]|uniref:hypothetical protein n=1 Tax=Diaphorobacter caeni TaxID=2784387 RepID=UPI00188EC97F|nr:hypothetical protein [Diaphorobacter caeni]MBF5006839.1 hypothetical protein [Diaphorobacter caeni]